MPRWTNENLYEINEDEKKDIKKDNSRRNERFIGKENKKNSRSEKESKKSKKNKLTKKQIEKQESTKDNKFSFDDEIVIGLRRIDEPIQKKKTSKRKEKNKQSKKKSLHKEELDNPIIIKSKYMSNYEKQTESDRKNKKTNKLKANTKNASTKAKVGKNTSNSKGTKGKASAVKLNKNVQQLTKQQELNRKRKKKVLKFVKWITILGIIVGGIIYALLSPIFNIKNISIEGNSKISSETIVSLSSLVIDQNIFNFRTSDVKAAIRENPYIDNVEVKRELPDTVKISVHERTETFMLTYGNAYVYINNQGYILKITSKKLEIPIILNYETPAEEIIEGNRLNIEDLEKLNDVLKVMEAISSGTNGLDKKVTTIDISSKTNYILTLEKEKKIVHLGDLTNLSTKILWLNTFVEEEKKNEGIIYLNVNLNTDLPYFRESV